MFATGVVSFFGGTHVIPKALSVDKGNFSLQAWNPSFPPTLVIAEGLVFNNSIVHACAVESIGETLEE